MHVTRAFWTFRLMTSQFHELPSCLEKIPVPYLLKIGETPIFAMVLYYTLFNGKKPKLKSETFTVREAHALGVSDPSH